MNASRPWTLVRGEKEVPVAPSDPAGLLGTVAVEALDFPEPLRLGSGYLSPLASAAAFFRSSSALFRSASALVGRPRFFGGSFIFGDVMEALLPWSYGTVEGRGAIGRSIPGHGRFRTTAGVMGSGCGG